MNRIIVRRSTGAWLMVVAIGLFGIVSGIMRFNHNARGGYLLPCVGFVVLLSAAFQLIMTGPRVVIDEEGISGILTGNVKIPWQRVRDADLKYVPRGDPVITLWLDDHTTRRMTLGGITMSPDRIYTEIQTRIAKYGSGASKQSEPENEDEDNFE